ncbi:MAG TPA: hypothetical protein VKA57_14495 [Solirubrobacteraceae bacterium]|nr:hypothetical protein [Solirubrobacteraceae bacterium]
MRRLARLLPALVAATAVAACGADDEQPAASAQPDTTRLTVEVSGARPEPITIRLRCGGSEPCDRPRLDKLAEVAKPDDPARACTLVYGGPEKARVTGMIEGRPVDVTVTRTNGCGIAEYEALFAALGRKPPVAP